MHIWVDADACPKVIKDFLFRASERAKLPVTLVANQPLNKPAFHLINTVQVAAGFDVADHYIVENCKAGDLVVTADIPLAAEVIAKQAKALSPRGDLYTEANIKSRLSMRNFMTELRNSGVETGGPSAFSHSDRQHFANKLDRMIQAYQRES